jgi:hypothetical protein
MFCLTHAFGSTCFCSLIVLVLNIAYLLSSLPSPLVEVEVFVRLPCLPHSSERKLASIPSSRLPSKGLYIDVDISIEEFVALMLSLPLP